MALQITVSLGLNGSHTKAVDLGAASRPITLGNTIVFSDGSGVGQINEFWDDTQTISGSTDIDVAGGVTNIYGVVLALARIKLLYVKAAAANTQNITVGRPAANGIPLFSATSDSIVLRPGGMFLWVAPDATGIAVTAATADLINITPASGSQTFDIAVGGALS